MKNIKNIYNLTMNFCCSLILSSVAICLVIGVPALVLFTFLPCGE